MLNRLQIYIKRKYAYPSHAKELSIKAKIISNKKYWEIKIEDQ